MSRSEVGITVMPEYFQSDGVGPIIETVADGAGATSVTTSPYIAAPSQYGIGHREPPIDGGAGKGRLLDRALWGKRELWMTAASSFVPDRALYEGLRYRPPEANALTETSGALVSDFFNAAKARGLKTWLQIQAAIPPCHRVQFGGPHADDHCLTPDNLAVTKRVDNNASLASEDLRKYVRAFVKDLYQNYPQVDGFRFDWPEYPTYQFECLLFDFNPSAARFAATIGLDFETLRRGCLEFLAELSSGAVRRKKIALDDFDSFRQSLFAAYPILFELIAFRRAIVADYGHFLHDTVAEASSGRSQLFLQCFPPPLNAATGFDLATMANCSDEIGVKLYTMHWPMIERNYLQWLTERTDFEPIKIAVALSAILRLSKQEPRLPEEIKYPEPDEPHPCTAEDLVEKLRIARKEVPADTRMSGITHAYGPLDDFVRRLRAVSLGANGAVQINRFAYMSDEKLAAVKALSRDRGTEINSVPK